MRRTNIIQSSASNQDYFDQRVWTIIDPKQNRIKKKLATLPRLSDFMDVVQGFVTGQDKVFIRN